MNEPYMDFVEFRDLMSFLEKNVKCPYCGESHYQELESTTTALYWKPAYKNGVLTHKNPNKTVTYCHCLNCDKNFAYQH